MSLVGTHIAHVRIERLLGEGGMGEVYLGLDEKLERRVAVKVLTARRRLKPEAKARFLREARLLSRLDDPGICRIYDLVEGEDTDYLILEFVDGVDLNEAVGTAQSDEDSLRLFLGVARALAVAHREGIVHRDLKPDNVMVTGDGQVKVLDFGIARSVGAQVVAERRPSRSEEISPDESLVRAAGDLEPGFGPTRTMESGETDVNSPDVSEQQVHTLHTRVGSVMGTIRYMSPEQASGEEVTEASDLYSLGVMMQELLSGKPAYVSASGMGLLLKVYRAETVPITGVDPEVAELITELTRIDPAARPDAMVAADRLQHVLDRPQRERRRRLRFAAAAVVAAAIVAAAAVAVHARLQAGRRAELAQTFARQAEEISWRMRAEHLSPVHDIRPAIAEMTQRMQALEDGMGELGELAAGPGNAALGRGHLALGELDEARRHLEAAHAAGFRSPESDFALGLVYGRLYSRGLTMARRIPDPLAKAEEVERLQRELRDPAIALLVENRSQTGVASQYVEGLIARYEERFGDGLAAVQAMAQTAPWFYEALQLEGDIHRELSVRAGDASRDVALQGEEIRLAVDALGRAALIGRSDPAIHGSLCAYRGREMGALIFGNDPMVSPETIESAFAPCETALAVDAEASGVEANRSMMFVLLAMARERHGLDGDDAYHEATAAAERAVALEPESPAALTTQGWVDNMRANAERLDGIDPRPAAERAIVAYERVLELLPDDPSIVVAIGNCCWISASYELTTGGDPRPWVDRGVARLQKRLQESPEHAGLQGVLGALLTQRGVWQRAHGLGGEQALRESIQALEVADAQAPNPDVLTALAHAHGELAIAALAAGADPASEVEQTMAFARRSAELFPGFPWAWYLQGQASLIQAQHAVLVGDVPDEWLARAAELIENGLEVSAEDPLSGYSGLVAVHVLEARSRMDSGRSPREALRAARVAVEAALAIDSSHAETLYGVLELETLAARWRIAGGASPAAAFSRAEAIAEQAIAANADIADGRRALAELYLWRARWLRDRGEPAAAAVQAGLEAVAATLEINPRLAEAELARGELELMRVQILGNTAEAENAKQLARAAFDRAVELSGLLESRVPR